MITSASHTPYALLLLCSVGVFLSGCTPPSDPVLLGQLCTQVQQDCSDRVVLERGVSQGRNAIDFELVNTSNTPQQVLVRVGPAAVFDEVFAQDQTPDEITDEEEAALQESEFYLMRMLTIPAGDRILDRLTSDKLGRESRLWFSVECVDVEDCDIVMNYVLLVDPLECANREDCLSGWECDAERGRCLECVTGENMCATEQTCELGRCTPPEQSTCQSTPGSSPYLPPWWLVCAGLTWGWRRRWRGLSWA